MEPLWFPGPSSEPLPKHVVRASTDVLVGRTRHEGEMLPATVIPEKSCAHVCKNGLEFEKSSYELLIGEGYSWQSCEYDYFPLYAKAFKTKRKGEPLFIGRVNYKGSVRVGRVNASQGMIYFPYNGEEIKLRCYDVLILHKSANWISARPFYTPSDAVVGSYDRNYSPIYVGRALHNGTWVLAKVIPDMSRAYIYAENEEIYVRDYQLLCGNNYRWHTVRDKCIPPNAVFIGTTASGQPLYVRRSGYRCDLSAGIVSPSKRYIITPNRGKEWEYDILVDDR